MANECLTCPVERDCYYPYKPTDCFNQRKFWSKAFSEKQDKVGQRSKELLDEDIKPERRTLRLVVNNKS